MVLEDEDSGSLEDAGAVVRCSGVTPHLFRGKVDVDCITYILAEVTPSGNKLPRNSVVSGTTLPIPDLQIPDLQIPDLWSPTRSLSLGTDVHLDKLFTFGITSELVFRSPTQSFSQFYKYLATPLKGRQCG